MSSPHHAILGNLSTKTTQKGLLQVHCPGGFQVKSLLVEAERKLKTEQESNGDHTDGIASHPLPHRTPLMVSSKRETAMDGQRKSTPIAKPVPQHVGLVNHCHIYSSFSVLTIYHFVCRGVRSWTPLHRPLSQGTALVSPFSKKFEYPKRPGKKGSAPAGHTDRLGFSDVGPSTYSFNGSITSEP